MARLRHTLVLPLLALVLVLGTAWWVLRFAPDTAPAPSPALPEAAALAPPPAAGAALDSASGRLELSTEAEPAPPAWILRGRTMLASGEARGGLHLRLALYEGLRRRGEPIAEIRLASEPDGSFRWTLSPPTGNVTIFAWPEEEGFGDYPAAASIRLGDPPPDDLQLRFDPIDFRIAGTVRSHEGVPLAGARVESGRAVATTDTDGRYELGLVVRGGSTFVHAAAAGFERARTEVERAAGGEAATADFALRPEFRIEGRVLDETGQPVAEAAVQTFFSMGFPVLSAADGSFVVAHLDPSRGEHHLYARKEGYAEANTRVSAAIGAVAHQDLVLTRGVALAGVVVDEAGRPLAGAGLYLGEKPSIYDRLDADSDAEGRFLFPAVPRRSHTLVTQLPGWAPDQRQIDLSDAPDRPEPLAIVLAPGCHVAGVVVNETGAPLADVFVSSRFRREYLDLRTQTDTSGRFRLEGLPAVELSLELYRPGLIRTQEKIPPGSHDDLVLRMVASGRLAGRVVDGLSGAPVPEFRIRFYYPQLQPGQLATRGWTGAWGGQGQHFRHPEGLWDSGDEPLEAGRYVGVEASAAGYGIARLDSVLIEMEPAPGALRIEMFPAQPLRGRVLEGASGAPVAGARVQCQPADRSLRLGRGSDLGSMAQTTISGTDGDFVFESVAAGELVLLVDHADWAPAVDGPFEVRPAVPIPEREIRLSGGAAVHGNVRGADGQAVAGAEVELESSAGSRLEFYVRRATADGAGGFRFDHLPPGSYQLRHLERNGPFTAYLASARLSLVEGEDLEFDLRPTGDASVVGELVSTREIPPLVLVFACSFRESEDGGEAETFELSCLARDGHFEFHGLSAGTWTLSAGGLLGSNRAVTVDLAPGGQATVQIVLE